MRSEQCDKKEPHTSHVWEKPASEWTWKLVECEGIPEAPELEGAVAYDIPEFRQLANAGEFAAVWNARTPEQREALFQAIIGASNDGYRCKLEDHEGLKEQFLDATAMFVAMLALQPEPMPQATTWAVSMTHTECLHCEAAVEEAVKTAMERNQDEATWTIVTPDGTVLGLEHVGRAARTS